MCHSSLNYKSQHHFWCFDRHQISRMLHQQQSCDFKSTCPIFQVIVYLSRSIWHNSRRWRFGKSGMDRICLFWQYRSPTHLGCYNLGKHHAILVLPWLDLCAKITCGPDGGLLEFDGVSVADVDMDGSSNLEVCKSHPSFSYAPLPVTLNNSNPIK